MSTGLRTRENLLSGRLQTCVSPAFDPASCSPFSHRGRHNSTKVLFTLLVNAHSLDQMFQNDHIFSISLRFPRKSISARFHSDFLESLYILDLIQIFQKACTFLISFRFSRTLVSSWYHSDFLESPCLLDFIQIFQKPVSARLRSHFLESPYMLDFISETSTKIFLSLIRYGLSRKKVRGHFFKFSLMHRQMDIMHTI